MSNVEKLEIEIGDKKISFEVGEVARQAAGGCFVRMGDTVVLVAAAHGTKPREDRDFFPLTVDYRERTYAAGRIPGGFFKREGKARDGEILTSRIIDRSVRPLFPEFFRLEVQLSALTLSHDGLHDTDILAVLGASISLGMSALPWNGPIGAIRIGRVDERFLLNPTLDEQERSTLDLVVAGKKGSILMVEAGSYELSEEMMLEALSIAQVEIDRLCDLQTELFHRIGKPKMAAPIPAVDLDLSRQVNEMARNRFKEAVRTADKATRENMISAIKTEVKEKLVVDYPDAGNVVNGIFEAIEYEEARRLILDESRRTDGRGFEEVRQITIRNGVLPRTHGSSLFTRGQTQALAVATLGSPADQQIMDELEGEYKERFMLHYNFPGFSTGEPKPERGPGRREVGHGALARRALLPLLPDPENFPYTMRVVSDILESNGSSSMASVCGGSLALFDAGVPMKKACAGMAMGLVKEGERSAVLTDIMGMEDHLGDMDFKVAGTTDGITALQMDIKIEGISIAIMKQALEQAKRARLFVLGKMNEVLAEPRAEMSAYAPRMEVVQIPVAKIGALIGPGGKNIRRIIEESGAQVDVEDDGKVYITASDRSSLETAKHQVESYSAEVELGKIYKGTVVRIMPKLGAFVEVMPGKDGLVHISQLDVNRVEKVEDAVKVGDEIEVKVIEIDTMGRVNLSRKAVLKPGSELEGGGLPSQRGAGRGGPDSRGGRDGRGGPPRREFRGGGERRGGSGDRPGGRGYN
ncbi:MAG: polyribonucleotide nucleotidyltransferase [Elusimicrobia bacterium]|jgi:polyribonucleotide nucleotidyltransferase|nr:polyribonucleotide nucleotidyltransferase [Elusimicrobiota bacterium]